MQSLSGFYCEYCKKCRIGYNTPNKRIEIHERHISIRIYSNEHTHSIERPHNERRAPSLTSANGLKVPVRVAGIPLFVGDDNVRVCGMGPHTPQIWAIFGSPPNPTLDKTVLYSSILY